MKISKKQLAEEVKDIFRASDESALALIDRLRQPNKKSLYQRADTLCDKLYLLIVKITKECKDSPCIIDEEKTNIFTKMYNINKSFEYIAKARELLRDIDDTY